MTGPGSSPYLGAAPIPPSTHEPEGDVVTQPNRPTYTVSTLVNGQVVGEFMRPIPDPLARTVVTVGWRDVLRSLLTRRTLTVVVHVSADSDTATRLLELDPDYLGPAERCDCGNCDINGCTLAAGGAS